MAFLQLSARRQSGMAVNPLTYSELEAFCRLTKVEFSAWQVSVLMRLDDLALRIADERSKGAKPRPRDDEQTGYRGMHPVKATLIERAAKTSGVSGGGEGPVTRGSR